MESRIRPPRRAPARSSITKSYLRLWPIFSISGSASIARRGAISGEDNDGRLGISSTTSSNWSVRADGERWAKGKYAGTKNRREGLVVRPQVAARASTGDRLSFKVLNNEFLLKDED